MLAVKVFAEGVAEQIKAYLPPEYESVTCSVKEQNKTNGVLQVGIQADMPGHAASPFRRTCRDTLLLRLSIWNPFMTKCGVGNQWIKLWGTSQK